MKQMIITFEPGDWVISREEELAERAKFLEFLGNEGKEVFDKVGAEVIIHLDPQIDEKYTFSFPEGQLAIQVFEEISNLKAIRKNL